MGVDDGAGREASEVQSPKHRRPGNANFSVPRDASKGRPSFARDVREDTRLVLLSVVVPLGFGVGGVDWAYQSAVAWWQRLAGLLMTLASMLVLASFGLRYTGVLEADHWGRSPLRRTVQWTLQHAWHVFLLTFAGLLACFVLYRLASH